MSALFAGVQIERQNPSNQLDARSQRSLFGIILPSWQYAIMAKTQVQIPDELFNRAKRVAVAREWSFAEIVRRGLEYKTRVNPPHRESAREWRLPEAVPMGQPLAPEAD